MSKLKIPEVAENYKQNVDTKLNIDLFDTESTCSEMWEKCKEAINCAAEEVLGREESKTQATWFDAECQQVTDEKNKSYMKIQQGYETRRMIDEYQEKRRVEKRIHKKKKKEWMKAKLVNTEILREQNCSREFFKEININRKPFKPRVNLCRHEDGSIISDEQEILNRWVRHFDATLNGTANNVIVYPHQSKIVNDGENYVSDAPTAEEIYLAIEKLRNNKAPGSDNISAELLKYGSKKIVLVMEYMFSEIWKTEEIPEEWLKGIICPLHKKGDQLDCTNYRGITLLNSVYKVLSNILYYRLSPYVENIIGCYQAGFRPGRSTINQIFSLRQIGEKMSEFNISTHYLFIDYKGAYDSIRREYLYKAMLEFGIPETIVRIIKLIMTDTESQIKIQSTLSPVFKIFNGVRQGDALACLLFNIVLESVIRRSSVQTRGTIFYKSTQLIAYADDIVIIGRSLDSVKEAFQSLEVASKEAGLIINESKTKYMASVNLQNRNILNFIQMGDYKFEIVNTFNYLGSLVTSNNNITLEISNRLMSANKAYFDLINHFKSRLLSRKSKIILHKTLISSVLTYTYETWILTKDDERRFGVFERRILVRIAGPIF